MLSLDREAELGQASASQAEAEVAVSHGLALPVFDGIVQLPAISRPESAVESGVSLIRGVASPACCARAAAVSLSGYDVRELRDGLCHLMVGASWLGESSTAGL